MEYMPLLYVCIFTPCIFILLIYAAIDRRNPFYANVIAAFLALLMSGMMALDFTNSTILTWDSGTQMCWNNVALAIFFTIMALVSIAYVFLQIYLVFMEKTGRLGKTNGVQP